MPGCHSFIAKDEYKMSSGRTVGKHFKGPAIAEVDRTVKDVTS